jgi:hypothetical protein
MPSRYHPEPSPSIITNDLYLAAFLHCVGCELDHVERNDRRRVSFVFVGERVGELREAYRTGPVKLDMRAFRESLIHVRRLMDTANEQRSASHVRAHHHYAAAQA